MSTESESSLFRQEVLAAQSDTASGASLDIRPVSAAGLTAFFAGLAVCVLGVLVGGSYTRKEKVQGVLQALDGVAQITAPDAGVVVKVRVSEGQAVQAGEVLAEVDQERFSDASGQSTQAQTEGALNGQRQQLLQQVQGKQAAQSASLAALAQRAAQARQDLDSLDQELALQGQLVASSLRLLEQWKPLRADHIVSELQFNQQQQTVTEQQARRQALRRQRSAAQAELAQAQQEQQRLNAQARVERAGLQRELLGLEQEQAQRRGAHHMWVKAPADGVISGLAVTPGQSVSAGTLLASLAPRHAALEAVLYVPSTGVGFIQAGQSVRLSYDAFPYQRFGQYRGTVRSVSATDVPANRPGNSDQRALFQVRVALQDSQVQAYGQAIALRPGHTLSADIEIDRRRLIRWMIDPLLAFSGQL